MKSEGFQALMHRLRQGDEDAAAEIVRSYEPGLTRLIRVRLLDRRLRRLHGESDVFQSVMGSFFVRVALGQYDLQKPEDLLKLLSVMVRNKVAEKARRRDVGRDADDLDGSGAAVVPSTEPSPSRIVAMRQLAREARARLAPELLEVIALRDEDLGWKEIAERVGGNPDALRKRLARAVDEISEALGVEDGGA